MKNITLAIILTFFFINISAQSKNDINLIEAARDLNWIKVGRLIKKGADVNTRYSNSMTALHYAAREGSGVTVEKLIENGADVNSKTLTQWTPLLLSANNYDSDWDEYVFTYLIEHGADITATNDKQQNASHLLLFRGEKALPLLKHLTKAGFDFNMQDENGDTPLHYAVEYEKTYAIEPLLEAGASLTVKNNKGQSPFDMILEPPDEGLSKYQLKYREEFQEDCIYKMRKYLGQVEPERSIRIFLRYNFTKELDSLLNQDINLSSLETTDSLDLFNYAVFYGTADHLKKMVHAGVNTTKRISIEYMGWELDNPLNLAIARGKPNVLRYLVEELNMDITGPGGSENSRQITPVLIASSTGSTECLKYLLQHGADISSGGNGEIYPPLIAATYYDQSDIVEILLEAGVDIEIDYKGKTAVMYAALKGHDALLKLLINQGADIHKKDHTGSNALVMGMLGEELSEESLILLIERTTDLNFRTQNGQSLLHFAAFYYSVAISEKLVERGLDINCVDNSGNTPLHFATHQEDLKTCVFLIKNGADMLLKNNNEKTPYDLAWETDYWALSMFFQNYRNYGDKIDYVLVRVIKRENQAAALKFYYPDGDEEIKTIGYIDEFRDKTTVDFWVVRNTFVADINRNESVKAVEDYNFLYISLDSNDL